MTRVVVRPVFNFFLWSKIVIFKSYWTIHHWAFTIQIISFKWIWTFVFIKANLISRNWIFVWFCECCLRIILFWPLVFNCVLRVFFHETICWIFLQNIAFTSFHWFEITKFGLWILKFFFFGFIDRIEYFPSQIYIIISYVSTFCSNFHTIVQIILTVTSATVIVDSVKILNIFNFPWWSEKSFFSSFRYCFPQVAQSFLI